MNEKVLHHKQNNKMHTTMQQVSTRMKNTHFIFGIIVVYYYICNTVGKYFSIKIFLLLNVE